jgi:hypothetical protein
MPLHTHRLRCSRKKIGNLSAMSWKIILSLLYLWQINNITFNLQSDVYIQRGHVLFSPGAVFSVLCASAAADCRTLRTSPLVTRTKSLPWARDSLALLQLNMQGSPGVDQRSNACQLISNARLCLWQSLSLVLNWSTSPSARVLLWCQQKPRRPEARGGKTKRGWGWQANK